MCYDCPGKAGKSFVEEVAFEEWLGSTGFEKPAQLVLHEQVHNNVGCRSDLMNWNSLCSPRAPVSWNPCKWHLVSDSGTSGLLGWNAGNSRLESSARALWCTVGFSSTSYTSASIGQFCAFSSGMGRLWKIMCFDLNPHGTARCHYIYSKICPLFLASPITFVW